MRGNETHEIQPFGLARRIGADWLELGKRKHHVMSLLELDVTEAREAMRRHRQQTGERFSFFSWIVMCVGRAVNEHKEVNAYRGRQGIVVFDDVDISVVVEKTVAGAKTPAPYLIRNANTKTAIEIHQEIRAAQTQDISQGYQVLGQKKNPWAELFYLLPAALRQRIWRWILGDPFRVKRTMGTVVVTSLMSGARFNGWAIPIGVHTVCFALGAVVKKPGVVGDRIEVREYLNLTVLVDHDIVDGMPAARLLSRLAAMVEGGYGLS
jgi:pyruvate/2-oxoglutarate dehydrogenase complex dihydrolipoamide acyltransferase (E2) component